MADDWCSAFSKCHVQEVPICPFSENGASKRILFEGFPSPNKSAFNLDGMDNGIRMATNQAMFSPSTVPQTGTHEVVGIIVLTSWCRWQAENHRGLVNEFWRLRDCGGFGILVTNHFRGSQLGPTPLSNLGLVTACTSYFSHPRLGFLSQVRTTLIYFIVAKHPSNCQPPYPKEDSIKLPLHMCIYSIQSQVL